MPENWGFLVLRVGGGGGSNSYENINVLFFINHKCRLFETPIVKIVLTILLFVEIKKSNKKLLGTKF